MNNYIDFKARHVAALLLIEARKGIRPPVIINSKGLNITEWIVPRRNFHADTLSFHVGADLVYRPESIIRWWKNEEAMH